MIKALASVLEPYPGRSAFRNLGARVLVGQSSMRSASHMFLGWFRAGRPAFDFYVRQPQDIEFAVNLAALDSMLPGLPPTPSIALGQPRMPTLRRVTPWQSAATSALVTCSTRRLRFATSYAKPNERHHVALKKAVAGGNVRAEPDAAVER